MLQNNTPSHLPHAELSIAGDPLSFLPEAKILGVWFKNNLQWDKHINELSMKANQNFYNLRLLKRLGFNYDELLSIYKCYVRPDVEYVDVALSSSVTAAQRKFWSTCKNARAEPFLGQRYTIHAELWRPVGLSLLLIGGKIIVVGLPKDLPIVNLLMISSLLPDWSLTPAT